MPIKKKKKLFSLQMLVVIAALSLTVLVNFMFIMDTAGSKMKFLPGNYSSSTGSLFQSAQLFAFCLNLTLDF